MNNYKIVSFYSEPNVESTFYTLAANKLINDCKHFNLDHYIVERKSKGSYLKNVREKPLFIKECIEKFNDKTVLWLDVDTRIIKRPIFPSENFDVGLVKKKNNGKVFPYFGHCILFNRTENANILLETYVNKLSIGSMSNHRCLMEAIKDNPNIMIIDLVDLHASLKIGISPKQFS